MSDINYIKHLNGVFNQFSKDNRLNPTHISLYIALFQIWNHNFFKEEFYINREEVMGFSKIGSKSTYHRCIKELSYWKYLLYTPSHNPFKGSRIKMFDFSPERPSVAGAGNRRAGTSVGQALYPSRTKNGTSAGQALVPIVKQIQTLENNKNLNKQQIFKNSDFPDSENDDKRPGSVPNTDNLKTIENKDYNQPL